MTVNLKNFSITNYDSEISDNVKFLDEIKNDEEISENLSDAPLALEKSGGVSNLRLGVAYLVKEKEENIGLIRLAKKNIQEHSLSIDIAIREACRDKGYGKVLLAEISDYIFKNSTLIKSVKLNSCVDSNESKKKVLSNK